MSLQPLLVANPTAQSGKAEARISHVLDRMRQRGWSPEFLSTQPDRRTVTELATLLSQRRFDTVIYMGGDGTFAEVAKGLLSAGYIDDHCPMGMLPSGTANDQGKSFGISSADEALEENLDIVEEGYQIKLDVGRIEAVGAGNLAVGIDMFFDSIGWGMNPDILSTRNRTREQIREIPLLREIYSGHAEKLMRP